MDIQRSVLLTRAAGFIGFHIVLKLLGAGRNVTGLDNNGYYVVGLDQDRLALLGRHRGDVKSPAGIKVMEISAPVKNYRLWRFMVRKCIWATAPFHVPTVVTCKSTGMALNLTTFKTGCKPILSRTVRSGPAFQPHPGLCEIMLDAKLIQDSCDHKIKDFLN